MLKCEEKKHISIQSRFASSNLFENSIRGFVRAISDRMFLNFRCLTGNILLSKHLSALRSNSSTKSTRELFKWPIQSADLLYYKQSKSGSFIISSSSRNVNIDSFARRSTSTRHFKREREPSFWTLAHSVKMVVLEICAIVLVVLVVAAAISEKVRSTVISSNTYKKAFAVHMNLFSRIHNRAVRNRKEAMFALMKQSLNDVQGDILEIGAGTGANFEFLPEGSSVIALDPNPHMVAYLVENAQRFPHVYLKKIVPGFAENMEGIADESVAAVVCTLTLCSVHDMQAALTEIKRVLKPVRTCS